MSLDKNREKISRMILNYLKKNPDAADTLEGITKWWLEFERIEISAKEVKDALDDLIEKGNVRIFKSKDGTYMYKIS